MSPIRACSNLVELYARNNLIDKIDSLDECRDLKVLWLTGNPIEYRLANRYRSSVIAACIGLYMFDGSKVTKAERQTACYTYESHY